MADIHCPKCRWEPRALDRWECSCGHVWNTFDTFGRCPKCRHVWRETMCLSCVRWSPHADWYHNLPDVDVEALLEEGVLEDDAPGAGSGARPRPRMT